ncbi:GNAT family N-acetyltransferase [Candidatus Pacearchaeota archaeon]|nr:GNAT family N-acetyltransferase [Candidatus Pacearchaeota archaeon]
MKIRKATKKDLKAYKIMRAASMEYFSKISGEKIRSSLDKGIKEEFEMYLSRRDKNLLIFEVRREIAGYMGYMIKKTKYKNFAYLEDVFIKKKFRGQGYGNKLVKYFMKIAKEKGIEKMGLGTRVENKNAIKLYKKLGFKVIGYNFGKRIASNKVR